MANSVKVVAPVYLRNVRLEIMTVSPETHWIDERERTEAQMRAGRDRGACRCARACLDVLFRSAVSSRGAPFFTPPNASILGGPLGSQLTEYVLSEVRQGIANGMPSGTFLIQSVAYIGVLFRVATICKIRRRCTDVGHGSWPPPFHAATSWAFACEQWSSRLPTIHDAAKGSGRPTPRPTPPIRAGTPRSTSPVTGQLPAYDRDLPCRQASSAAPRDARVRWHRGREQGCEHCTPVERETTADPLHGRVDRRRALPGR